MKRNRLFALGVFIVLVSFTIAIGTAIAEDTVMGTVVEVDDGFVIQAADGSLIQVDEDLSEMVGKKVRIIGTIQEGDTGKVISINQIEELK